MKRLLIFLCLPFVANAETPTAAIKNAAATTPEAPLQAIVPPPVPAGWTLGAGIQWRQMGEVSFDSMHQTSVDDLPPVRRVRSGSTGYQDGYVLPDSSGGSQTWNWGFDNASQVSGDLLNLHRSSTEVISVLKQRSFDTSWSDDLAAVGVFVKLESPELIRFGGFGLSAQAGYSFAQDDTRQRALAWQAERYLVERRTTHTDSFDVSGIAPVTPQQGTYNGPGPVISGTPATTSSSMVGGGSVIDDSVYSSHLEQSLQLRLHTLSLGPKASWNWKRLRLMGGAGFGLNIADWDAESVETLTSDKGKWIKEWHEGSSGTEVLAGVYVEFGAEYALCSRWSVFASGRYDWIQDFSGEIAVSSFDVDLGGWTAMLGLSWRF